LIASVILSAYISTLPLTWRAARPIVWINAVLPAQEAFLVRIEDRDERHLRQVEPSRRRFTPTSTSYSPSRSSRMIWIRSSVSISECR
jgi:hypothetical protein